jgi:carboxypeptidase C (cathepsin A)
MHSKSVLIAFLAVFAVGISASRNLLTNLPGYSGPELTQYTGYITVNEEAERALFYWFIESQNDPSTDPLVFWFQGGPGCSGLIGLLTESGPYVPSKF